MIERTLVMLKPGNFDYAIEIFSCLDDLLSKTGGFRRLLPVHISGVDREIMEEFYSHIRDVAGQEIFDDTIRAFAEGEIIVAIYEGDKIVERVRSVVGNTAPEKAGKNTVRGIFVRDSLEKAAGEKRYLNNILHAPRSMAEAEKGIELLRRYLD